MRPGIDFSNLRLVGAFAFVAFFYLFNLGTPVLWSDESETAVIGESVLREGLPYATDRNNFIVLDNCDRTGAGLLTNQPWIQYYVSAVSQSLFGKSTFGTRIAFALIGLSTFFPLYGLLATRTRTPLTLTMLLMLSPQVLLFQRNARYYPIITFLFAALLYLMFSGKVSRTLQYWGTAICAVFFFQAHSLAAAGSFAGLFAAVALFDRSKTKVVAVGSVIGLISWIAFSVLMPPLAPSNHSILHLFTSDFGQWASLFWGGVRATFLDLDFCNALPLVAYGVLAVYCLMERRERLSGLSRDPLVVTVFLALFLQTAAVSAILGYESTFRFALLRYVPHVILFLSLPLFFLLGIATKNENVAVCVFGALSLLNISGLSVWNEASGPRVWRASWWAPVYSEILFPPRDAQADAIDALSKSQESAGATISIVPEFLVSTYVYSAGDRFFFQRQVAEHSACAIEVSKALGPEKFAKIRRPPDSLFVWSKLEPPFPGYTTKALFPAGRMSPDSTRPELTRHGFYDLESNHSCVAWLVPQ